LSSRPLAFRRRRGSCPLRAVGQLAGVPRPRLGVARPARRRVSIASAASFPFGLGEARDHGPRDGAGLTAAASPVRRRRRFNASNEGEKSDICGANIMA